mmetsp:Transcript_10440/g.23692  ORF Transcript_10440/g.23692 Transcript_10440/m.23692 type:complete len:679 (+) Transcript_10440:68-2104(+)|eukprot:CAMPEP_0178431742 /NCGR_PEP_ID=MMETSP0689_2-20121128/32017_1 /TAXON_ID=160604 /ORGANISM="Amphidinium massartii, Strain CS-259" /LENGTH=678 /DNA_ID=CAMNT_0020053689 /DNA_START=59 /DNA_END=2095 /DNA_ORIENTATION=+
MAKVKQGNLRTADGLRALDESLASRSYVDGTAKPTAADYASFEAVASLPDPDVYPNVVRWYRHMAGLLAQFPGRKGGASATNGGTSSTAAASSSEPKKAAKPTGKVKTGLVVDCQAFPWPDRTQPLDNPPPLGSGVKSLVCKGKGQGKYYITTAINYANGYPHIGHAYEGLTADAFARYHRLLGEETFFMTGSDEHGQKIADNAADQGITPIEACDKYVLGFKALNQRLRVANDFYIRTTADYHKACAIEMWKKCKAQGDIYLDKYEGWYLVREERYVTDQEAEEWAFKDPASGKPLSRVTEPSFFFRLSKYKDAVIEHIEKNDDFIRPQGYKTEILKKLKDIKMRDLSISRGSFAWGVPCPEDPVEGKPHVMYVWFDALTNYVSGVNGMDKSKPLAKFWPADMHIIGKDISWFHTVIWPAMLMSAGLPLPKSVVIHGFILGPDGRKMSKSLGNVVNAHDELDTIAPDTFRWYLCREAPYGDDLKFSDESLQLMHNSDLCDNLGNLVNRAVNLSGGAVPDADRSKVGGTVKLPFNLAELKKSVQEVMISYRLSEACDLIIAACGSTNKWIADLEPWKMKEESLQAQRALCCRLLLEAVYVLAHFFAPFIPIAGEAIFRKLGTEPRPIPELSNDFANLATGTVVQSGSILFEPFQIAPKEEAPAPKAKPAPKEKAKPKK